MCTLELERFADPVVAAATAGDESAFSLLVGRHRRELQAHAYRILGSHEDSEDVIQETFLQAWRRRETFEGRSSFRAWLYAIATRTSLSAVERRSRRRPAAGRESGSIGSLPAELVEELGASDAQPDAALVSKETVELAFLAAVRHLPPRQRAVLLLRDVLGWPAAQAAELLDTSVVAVNSALQRARATLRAHLGEGRLEWDALSAPTAAERAVLRRYLDAVVRWDTGAMVATLREDLVTG